jgi:hypothetical protein
MYGKTSTASHVVTTDLHVKEAELLTEYGGYEE